MNVYDFDGTIYYPDCTISFALWCAKRHPKLWFTFVPKAVRNLILYNRGKLPRYKMERQFFGFLGMTDDFEEQIEKFWDKHEKRISAWYLAQKKPGDLIISASPDCIIAPIAKRLGVKYMASEYDREFGVFTNNLMYAKEKARYMIDHGFPVIDNFYSDSLSDTPIALCAEKAYLITDKARKVNDWPDMDEETLKKVHRKICFKQEKCANLGKNSLLSHLYQRAIAAIPIIQRIIPLSHRFDTAISASKKPYTNWREN